MSRFAVGAIVKMPDAPGGEIQIHSFDGLDKNGQEVYTVVSASVRPSPNFPTNHWKATVVPTLTITGSASPLLVGTCNDLFQDHNWHPACGGTEEPFTTRTGKRLLYVWQPSTNRHAYLDLETDLILSDEEARRALDTY